MEVTRVAPFLEYWEKVRGRTRRVVDRIPPERLEWTWRAGKFTPGDLVRHLAGIERWMFAENARRRPSRYPGHGEELARGWPAVRDYFEQLHEESMEIFRGLTDPELAEKCLTPGGASIAIGKWLRLMIEHEIHHRGQIYLQLSMLGVETPPLYGLTSEEVRARSLEPEAKEKR
ncbi:MAG: DinB family protein [Thermoanaerobaculia bacterium]